MAHVYSRHYVECLQMHRQRYMALSTIVAGALTSTDTSVQSCTVTDALTSPYTDKHSDKYSYTETGKGIHCPSLNIDRTYTCDKWKVIVSAADLVQTGAREDWLQTLIMYMYTVHDVFIQDEH